MKITLKYNKRIISCFIVLFNPYRFLAVMNYKLTEIHIFYIKLKLYKNNNNNNIQHSITL